MPDQPPAFPTPPVATEGITARDWFAAMALAGAMASPHNPKVDADQFAVAAYAIADAMMRARMLPGGFISGMGDH